MNQIKNLLTGNIAIATVGSAVAVAPIAFIPPRDGGIKMSIRAKASGTTVRLSYKLLASFDGVTYVVPDDMSAAVLTVVDTAEHIKAVTPTVAPYYKIQIDGDTDNGANTIVTVLEFCISSER